MHPKKSEIDFVALTVHRLKSPLSSIKLSLEMLMEGDFGDLSPEQKKILDRTKQRCNIAIEIVNQLISVAKVDGQKVYTLSLVDFDGLVKSVVECEDEAVQKKGINLVIEPSQKKIPQLKIDKEKISWAIQNILNNAVKYTHVGGDITITYGIAGKNLLCTIKDNGIGIMDSDKGQIFDEFFRGENAREVDATGSGLGLYIAKNVIEWHKGKLYFESKEGRGTTFFIELPVEKGK